MDKRKSVTIIIMTLITLVTTSTLESRKIEAQSCMLTGHNSTRIVNVVGKVSGTNLNISWEQIFPDDVWSTIDKVSVIVGTDKICVETTDPTIWSATAECNNTTVDITTYDKSQTSHTQTGLSEGLQYYYKIMYIDNE